MRDSDVGKNGSKGQRGFVHLLAILSGCLALFFGCARERPYDELYKDRHLFSRAVVDTQAEYLYTSSTLGVPRFTEAMRPYLQGRERIIQWRWEEGGLTAYQIEEEAEFRDNQLNDKPILTIPGEYLSYRCALNEDDECSNREEVNTETTWEERDHFLPKYENIDVREADFLMLPDGSDPCFTEVGSRLIHREFGRDFVNIEIEKSYRFSDSMECVLQLWYASNGYQEFLDKLDDNGGTFNTRISFNFANLAKVSDPDYQALAYPVEDQHIFGFFSNNKRNKDIVGRTQRKYFLHRWSPGKVGAVDGQGNRLVTYTLSNEFNKPANAYLKKATEQAIERINFTLEKSRVKLRLGLVQGDVHTRSGDLRNSMINLVEDIASPLVGYGPSVANPRTGEIVRAHVNMYKGSLVFSAPYSYYLLRMEELEEKGTDDSTPPLSVANWQRSVIRTREAQGQNQRQVSGGGMAPFSSLVEKDLSLPSMEELVQKSPYRAASDDLGQKSEAWKDFLSGPRFENLVKQWRGFKTRDLEEMSFEVFSAKLERAMEKGEMPSGEIERAKHILTTLRTRQKGLKALQRNNVYTADKLNLMEFSKASRDQINAISGVRDQQGNLRPWSALSEVQRQKLVEILVSHAYIPVLVHEIGHNLGLRHNFAGSSDHKHFWGEEAQQVLGLSEKTNSSSIMDYIFSGLSELSTFGPYDIAALRYAYNREMAVVAACRPRHGQVSHPEASNWEECEELASRQAGDLLYQHVKKSTPKQMRGIPLEVRMQKLPEGVTASDVPSGTNFSYCTDEDRGQSLLCNAFDEGTTPEELLEHRIDDYKRSYNMRNMRMLRDHMNDRDHIWHLLSTFRRLAEVRIFHEMWQGAYNALRGNVPDGALYWGCDTITINNAIATGDRRMQMQCQWLQQIVNVNNMAGRFLLDLAKTPEKSCHAFIPQVGERTFTLGRDIPNIVRWVYQNQSLQSAEEVDVQRLSNCHDPWVIGYYQHVLAQVFKTPGLKIQMLGQRGRVHNDMAALQRPGVRRYVGDLEIRGFWMEKLLAMSVLTYQGMLTTRGANQYRSLFEHPHFREELGNLIEHYSYNLPLKGSTPFKAANGFEYHSTLFTTRLNYPTQSPEYHRFLRLFLPFPNQDPWKMGPVMLKMAAEFSQLAESELPSSFEIVSRVQAFRDFVTVNRYHSNFMTPNVLAAEGDRPESFSIPGINQTYVASERNGLALKLIRLLEGGLESNVQEIQQALVELSEPEAPITPESPETSGESETPEAPETSEVAETAETSETSETPETAEVPAAEGTEAEEGEPAPVASAGESSALLLPWPYMSATPQEAETESGQTAQDTAAEEEGTASASTQVSKANAGLDDEARAILNSMLVVKSASHLLANDIHEVERMSYLSGGNIQLFRQLMSNLAKDWGNHRVDEAWDAYRVKHSRSRGVMQKFFDMDFFDLIYFMESPQVRAIMKSDLLDALIGMPRQTVGVSF